MVEQRYTAEVCVGPSCGPKGGRKNADALRGKLEGQPVKVEEIWCSNNCPLGPNVFYGDGVKLIEHFKEVTDAYIDGQSTTTVAQKIIDTLPKT